MGPTMTLIAMLGAHSFLDYAGQGDFMSKAKNRAAPIPGVPWLTVLSMHALQQAAAVALITGVWWFGIIEYTIHLATDDAKCRNRISFNADQAIHVATKAGFWIALVLFPSLSNWSA